MTWFLRTPEHNGKAKILADKYNGTVIPKPARFEDIPEGMGLLHIRVLNALPINDPLAMEQEAEFIYDKQAFGSSASCSICNSSTWVLIPLEIAKKESRYSLFETQQNNIAKIYQKFRETGGINSVEIRELKDYLIVLERRAGTEIETLITLFLDPVTIAFYALNKYTHQRFLAAEPILKTNAEAAALYAYHNLQGRWPEAEDVIFNDPNQYEMYVFFLQSSASRRWVKPRMELAEVRRLLEHNEQGMLRWLKRVGISARSLTILDIFKYLDSPLIQQHLATQPNQMHLIQYED
jgi:hypothetical protein